jgi:hypothetical protein
MPLVPPTIALALATSCPVIAQQWEIVGLGYGWYHNSSVSNYRRPSLFPPEPIAPPNDISWTTIVHRIRRFRDIHVLTRHAFASFNRFESVGKLTFEQPADWPFLML